LRTPDEFELEDIKEQAELVGYLTPREYAKIRGMSPQLVYYHLRAGTIKDERCKCGRRVISVREADEALSKAARRRAGEPELSSDGEREEGEGDNLV